MPDINITVAHKVAVSDTQSIVCDNSDYTVHWALDEEWSAYDTKTMRTIYMDGTFTDKVFAGDMVKLPVCTVPGVVQIGLFAGDIRTSRVAILRALPSVRSAAGAPADPTPDVYDQLMARINDLGDVSAIVQSGYNDVVAAISNMFGKTETVLCTVTSDEFDENGICLIPSEHDVTLSDGSECHFVVKIPSVIHDLTMENVTDYINPSIAGCAIFSCNAGLVAIGCKVSFSAGGDSPTFESYNGICVLTNQQTIEQVSVVKVDVKKVPIEYVDTRDIESAIQSITDEVKSL
jgi:hypothetical protein